MDKIVVSVSDLLSRAKELQEDGMDLVELSFLDPQDEDGEHMPGCLWISGFKRSFQCERVDYDEIDALEGFD